MDVFTLILNMLLDWTYTHMTPMNLGFSYHISRRKISCDNTCIYTPR